LWSENAAMTNPWSIDQWSVIGLLPAQASQRFEKTMLRDDGHLSQYSWSGYDVALYLDDVESYHFNLEGESPSIFVIGEYADAEDETGEIVPLLVTLSYDEAASYMETDSPIFNLPIPGEIQLWVEQYVLDNYRPVEKKKRKRQRWQQDAWVRNQRPLGEYR
jgi:hypothetical protein